MKIFFSSECLEYASPGHPESPARIEQIYWQLKARGETFHTPSPCTDEDILRVHTAGLLAALSAGSFFDPDTPALHRMPVYAKLAAGAAINAMQAACTEGSGFSLMRPPGHHATRNRIMGFCYLNNIAIAAARYLQEQPRAKIAILDIDCHHGNGTEDIFANSPDRARVLYISLHQSPHYPGTGFESRENILNFPLPAGTDGARYLPVFRQACAAIKRFSPDLLGISAGFDTYKDDPLCNLKLDLPDYNSMGQAIAGLKLPNFLVMEGGYSDKLAACVTAFLAGLGYCQPPTSMYSLQ